MCIGIGIGIGIGTDMDKGVEAGTDPGMGTGTGSGSRTGKVIDPWRYGLDANLLGNSGGSCPSAKVVARASPGSAT
jgi:hypothetical protein